LLPILNQEVSERYAIPPSPPATITYTGLPLDEIEDALQNARAQATEDDRLPGDAAAQGTCRTVGLQRHAQWPLW
jgi:hypothetical protein